MTITTATTTTTTAGRAAAHAWEGRLVLWHAGFIVLTAVTALLLTFDGRSLPRLGLAYALLAALVVLYLLVGRPAMEDEQSVRSFLAYVVPAFLIVAAMLAVSPSSFVLMWVLYPQLFVLAPRFRWAIGGSVVLTGV